MRTTTTCSRTLPAGDPGRQRGTPDRELAELALHSWTLRVGSQPLLVRSGSARDLPAVAQMHARCSPRSLLDRYRLGGRPPTVAAIDRALRRPYSVVVATGHGDVIATGMVDHDATHDERCAEVSLLIEDQWQRLGIGTELMSHLAGVAQVAGFHQLIAYPATAISPVQRLMVGIGRTRIVPDTDAHLHTHLPESAALGLGSVRQRLAG